MIEEGGYICNTVAAALQAGTMSAQVIGNKIQFPTKILCFYGMTQGINIDDEEEFNNVTEDFREECGKYGKVISVVIPRKDVEDNPSPGMGNIYVEFNSVDESKEARKVSFHYKTLAIIREKI
jgi:hypothetical protein